MDSNATSIAGDYGFPSAAMLSIGNAATYSSGTFTIQRSGFYELYHNVSFYMGNYYSQYSDTTSPTPTRFPIVFTASLDYASGGSGSIPGTFMSVDFTYRGLEQDIMPRQTIVHLNAGNTFRFHLSRVMPLTTSGIYGYCDVLRAVVLITLLRADDRA
jgi:hypothetical protein